MATIPDKGTGISDIQSILFKEFIEVQSDDLNVVVSGLTVTGGASMTPTVAKGSVLSNGTLYAVAAGTVTIGAAHGTLPRIDLIVIDSSGAKQVRAGTASATPKPPARTANDVVIAAVLVPAAAATIPTANILDWRKTRFLGPVVIAKSTTEFTQNTLATAFNLLSQTIPNGLFLAGRVLRVRMCGTYLSNSGSPTWTFTVSYGGTTMWSDSTGATTADADRGAWALEFDLIAQGTTDQSLNGVVRFSTPGAKTAPGTGVAGDLAVVTDLGVPIKGTDAAVDSDSADRTLLVTCTMSVSNASVETTRSGYTVELL